ncbi:MAG: hypothetical protein HYU56_04715 [Candidatus Aenigmarchaeota archaeon]|nr:hypothetical protein [Candidatus Aenigmarchaeota archaeon]
MPQWEPPETAEEPLLHRMHPREIETTLYAIGLGVQTTQQYPHREQLHQALRKYGFDGSCLDCVGRVARAEGTLVGQGHFERLYEEECWPYFYVR